MKPRHSGRIKAPSYITRCKSPKKQEKVAKIIKYILIGLRKGYDTAYLAYRLNLFKVWTLMDRRWTPNSLQMQLLKLHRKEAGSSLAEFWQEEYKHGRIYESDLVILADRVRTA